MMEKILSAYSGWVVIDADGLNALSGRMEVLKTTKAQVVLTPHPGEMGRIVGKSTSEVQEDRVGIAKKLAADYGAWVILKGARTITASPNGMIFVNTTGNPWMASGGQGDVLTGILGGLLVQGIPPEEALPFGVYIHGLAADKLVEKIGPAPVTATDVLEEIRILIGGKGEEE